MREERTPPDYRHVVADNIAAERGRRHLSQTALARLMAGFGFTTWVRQTVTDVERGGRRVTAEEMLGLAVALQVPLDRLYYPPDTSPEVTLPGGQAVMPGARPPRDLSSLRAAGEVVIVPPEKREGNQP